MMRLAAIIAALTICCAALAKEAAPDQPSQDETVRGEPLGGGKPVMPVRIKRCPDGYEL
jgi:hypothetical protein